MTDPSFWFTGWDAIARILLIGVCGYVALLLVLKVTGARTLTQMNSFDFVVTIAIGASFGRMLTARDIPLAELLTAVGLLIILQFLMTKLQIRLPGTVACSRRDRCCCSGKGSAANTRCAAGAWPARISSQRFDPTADPRSRACARSCWNRTAAFPSSRIRTDRRRRY